MFSHMHHSPSRLRSMGVAWHSPFRRLCGEEPRDQLRIGDMLGGDTGVPNQRRYSHVDGLCAMTACQSAPAHCPHVAIIAIGYQRQ
jgi:hypothetical protein